MSRNPSLTVKILYLAHFMKDHTDAEHPATMSEILSYLESKGIAAERRSIYENFDSLIQYGMDIRSARRGSTTVYYLGKRDFEPSELKLLVDAVQSSKFITEKKSLDLIRRIERLGSQYQQSQLSHHVWVRGRVKTMNESIYRNVDRINEAFETNRQINFHYFTWDREKHRQLRRNGALYAASPWALLLDNENYYLLAYEAGQMKHFRVDKMLSLRILDREREGRALFESLNMAAYTDSHFGMFSGESMPVKLLFDNSMAGVAIDQFGRDAILVPFDDECFTVTVNVAVNIQFYGWLSGLGSKVRILAPQSAVEGMKQHMESVLALYHHPEGPFSSLLSVYRSLLFVDTETTGLSAEEDFITEFAAVLVRSGETQSFDTFVQLPEQACIPDQVSSITGITDAMCAGGMNPRQLAERIQAMITPGTLLVAYNAQFDASFLRKLAGRLDVDYLDILTVYRERCPGPHRLSDAIARYGVEGKNSHHAAEDVRALMDITRALEAEKADLLSYVNRFGFKSAYGIFGEPIEKVIYYEQAEKNPPAGETDASGT